MSQQDNQNNGTDDKIEEKKVETVRYTDAEEQNSTETEALFVSGRRRKREEPAAQQPVVPEPAPVPPPVSAPEPVQVQAPVQAPIQIPVQTPVQTPAQAPISQPITIPVSQPTTLPESQPVSQPVSQPISQPISQSYTESDAGVENQTKPALAIGDIINKQVGPLKLWHIAAGGAGVLVLLIVIIAIVSSGGSRAAVVNIDTPYASLAQGFRLSYPGTWQLTEEADNIRLIDPSGTSTIIDIMVIADTYTGYIEAGYTNEELINTLVGIAAESMGDSVQGLQTSYNITNTSVQGGASYYFEEAGMIYDGYVDVTVSGNNVLVGVIESKQGNLDAAREIYSRILPTIQTQ